MANTNTLVDLGDGTAVSSNSPQSPTGSALLDTPITLDFDPMSFQFKEDSPLTSPSDNSREIGDTLSPSQNTDVVDFFDPFCPVKEESPTDYYPHGILGQPVLGETVMENSNELLMREDFAKHEISEDTLISEHADEVCEERKTIITTTTFTTVQEITETSHSDMLITESPDNAYPTSPIAAEIECETLIEIEPPSESDDLTPNGEACIVEPVDLSIDERLNEDKTEHGMEQDEVFQHVECPLTDADPNRRGKTSSVSSIHSSKSDRSEKKSTTRKKSSTSSESSLKDEEPKSPKSPISLKSLKKEEIISQKRETVQEKKIISTSKSEKISYQAVNGVDKSISIKNGVDDDGEDIECQGRSESPECPVSVSELKSSFTKTDEVHQSVLQEEVKPSVDRAKVQRTFSQSAHDEKACLCKICGKHVYQMEKMKAEKNVFHKNCFRCRECNKLLNVDTYSSHEGEIFCKPHFRQLFQPKARFDGEDGAPRKQRRNELIIRENIPTELPPDVVRSDSKPDHGLESLPVNLNNLKSKFESFKEEHHLPSTTDVCTLQRSASVMARLAKYQSAVSGDNQENGVESNSESEEEGEEDGSVIKSTKHKEKVVFSGMSNLKSQWETGSVTATKEERMEEKKEELNKLRQRMCLGRSESMKAVYEKACQDSNKTTPTRSESVVLGRDVRATRIKEKFEKGELVSEVEEEKMEKARKEKEEDLSVFTEPGIANDAKKLFKQIDATVKTTAVSPTSPNKSPMNERKKNREVLYTSQSSVTDTDVIKCSEPTAKEDIPVDTTDVTERFKFFENYSEQPKERKRFQITPPREPAKDDTPDRDIEHDPSIVRAVDSVDDIPVTDTARRMLDKFKALEKEAPSAPAGPKPLKRITPPREYTKEGEHDSSPEPERDPNIVRASYKADEDIVVEADKAKSLRAKFENWEIEMRENRKNEEEEEEEEEEDFLPQVDTTKTLRAKFEAIKEDTLKPLEKPKPKVNRFIQEQAGTNMELCSICGKKVYPMEKMETSGMRLHKNCFRCAHCGCMLRLENYTTSGGRLYCTPHFKQLFISRGNYDEGFGREQHKEKWNRSCNNTPTPRDLHENGDVVHHDEYTNGDAQCLEQMA